MAPNQHQDDGNQWQHPDTEESFSTFPPSNDFQDIIELGSWDSTTLTEPNRSVDMNWSQHPDNTYQQQMHGDANDLPFCMSALSRDNRVQLDDPNNDSIESINAAMDMAKRKRQYLHGMPQQHVLYGSDGLHVPSNTTLSSFNYSGVSGTESSITTSSSTGMYADNMKSGMTVEDPNIRNRGLLLDELAQGFPGPVGNVPDALQFALPKLPQSGNQAIGLYAGNMIEW